LRLDFRRCRAQCPQSVYVGKKAETEKVKKAEKAKAAAEADEKLAKKAKKAEAAEQCQAAAAMDKTGKVLPAVVGCKRTRCARSFQAGKCVPNGLRWLLAGGLGTTRQHIARCTRTRQFAAPAAAVASFLPRAVLLEGT
jgi:hypothetical protein